MSDSQRPHGLQPTRLLRPWDFPGKSTGVGCHCLLQARILVLLLLLSCFSRVRLCDPMDGSPPGSPVPGILQARTMEWVAISFSNAGKWKVKVKSLSRVQLLATPWTAAYQAPLSMGFARQEYLSGCHHLLQARILADHKWNIQSHHSHSVLIWTPKLFNSCFNFVSWSQVTLLDVCIYWPFHLKIEMKLIKCRAEPNTAAQAHHNVWLRWKSPGDIAGIY